MDQKSGRFYYEMERDHSGQPILPVEIDSWTVLNLGVIDAERPAFHTARYIYPIGYTIKKYVMSICSTYAEIFFSWKILRTTNLLIFYHRWYRSMVDAKRDTQYTCRIVDGGEEPRVSKNNNIDELFIYSRHQLLC